MDLQNKALLWSEPELAGYMEKCGGGSTKWNRRFFLLQGSYLFYYANCVDVPMSDAMGVIPLEGAEVDSVDFKLASEVLGWCDMWAHRIKEVLLSIEPRERGGCMGKAQVICAVCTITASHEYLDAFPGLSLIPTFVSRWYFPPHLHINFLDPHARSYSKEDFTDVLKKIICGKTGEQSLPWNRPVNRCNAILLIVLSGELQAVRENAGLLEALLKESPSNLKNLGTPQGRESAALQDELKKVRNEYTKLKEVAKQTWAQAEELKKITLQALAVWEIMSDHVGGKNDKVDCNTVTRLKEEISVTQQVLELLSEKKKFMHGEGVEDLPKAAREQLQLICTRGIANIQDRRAQVRAVAPRYASSIHPALLPEGVEDPIPTLQDLQGIRGTTRPSRGSGGTRNFAELSDKWKVLKMKVETRTLGSLIHKLKAIESQPETSQTKTRHLQTHKSTEPHPQVSKSKDVRHPSPPSPPSLPLETIESKDSPYSTTPENKEDQLPETTRTEVRPRSEPPKTEEIQRESPKGQEPQAETSASEEPGPKFFGVKELELEPPREELVPAPVRPAHYVEQIAQFCKQYLQRFQLSPCLEERNAHGLQQPSPYLVSNCLHRSPPLRLPTEDHLGASSSGALPKRNVRCPRHQRLHDNPCFRMDDCLPIRELELADRETHNQRRHLQWHQQRHQYHQQRRTQQGEIHQGRQYHGYSKTTRKHRHQSPEFCVPKQQYQRWHSSRTSRGVKSSTRDDRSPSSHYYPGQPYPIRSFLPPGECRYLSPELFKPLTPSSKWKPNSSYWQRGCSPTNGGSVVSSRTNRVGLPTNPHC